jgi:hypothetical protein
MSSAAVVNTIVTNCFIFRQMQPAIGALDAVHRLHLVRFPTDLLLLSPKLADNEEYPEQSKCEKKKSETHRIDS